MLAEGPQNDPASGGSGVSGTRLPRLLIMRSSCLPAPWIVVGIACSSAQPYHCQGGEIFVLHHVQRQQLAVAHGLAGRRDQMGNFGRLEGIVGR